MKFFKNKIFLLVFVNLSLLFSQSSIAIPFLNKNQNNTKFTSKLNILKNLSSKNNKNYKKTSIIKTSLVAITAIAIIGGAIFGITKILNILNNNASKKNSDTNKKHQNYIKKLTEIINKKLNTNIPNNDPEIIRQACLVSNTETIKNLIKNSTKECISNFKNNKILRNHKQTPINFFCEEPNREKPNLEILKMLLENSTDIASDLDQSNKNSNSETALHSACEAGNLEIVNYILSIYPKNNLKNYINKPDACGKSALLIACKNGNKEIIDLLLKNGADESMAIIYKNKPDSNNISYLKSKKLDPIMVLACSTKDFSISEQFIKKLQEKNIDIKTQMGKTDNYGNTPLHLACENENIGLINYLLENGAKDYINCENDTVGNETPLLCAYEKGNTGIMNLLIENGASLEKTYIDHSYDFESKDNSQIIKPNDANQSLPRKNILMKALSLSSKKIIPSFKLLLDSIEKDKNGLTLKVYINDRDKYNRSLLNLVCSASYDDKVSLEIAKMLIEKGTETGSINAKDNHGWTPLELAKRFSKNETAKYLESQEATK